MPEVEMKYEEVIDFTILKYRNNNYEQSEDRKCRVCGASPAGLYYGAVVCPSCKIFFLRVTTVGAAIKECKNYRLCSSKNFRGLGKAKCIPCRYEKCLEVGMIPEITARRTGCNLREKRALVGQRYQIPASATTDKKELQMAAKFFTKPVFADGFGGIKQLVNLEKLLSNDDPTVSVIFDFPIDGATTIDQLIKNPLALCPRVPVGFHLSTNNQVPEHLMMTMGFRTFSRSLVMIIDWFRIMPEFQAFPEADQLTFIPHIYFKSALFIDYFYTHKYNFDGFLVCLGTRVTHDDIRLFQQLEKGFGSLISYGRDYILPAMKRAALADEEFVLMKNILAFCNSIGFSDKAVEIQRKAYQRYCYMLLKHLKEKYHSESKALEVFYECTNIINHMQYICNITMSQFEKSIILNESGMVGKLCEDFFKRLR
ncbi:unnamed protein product, partial [Mesorhabditis spiculigera]